MRIKALLALLGLGLALMLVAGCSDSDNNNRTLSGVITNASTGLPITGQATVTLFRNGVQIGQPATVGTDGRFTLVNVPEGSGYTVVIASTATPSAFQTFTSTTFSVTGSTNNLNFTVGTGITGTVSGTITDLATGLPLGAGEASVAIFKDGVQVDTSQLNTAGGGFSFPGIAAGSGYTIVVTSTATPEAFSQVTTSSFSVAGNTTQNINVGTSPSGETVTGTIGTSVVDGAFTVVAKNAAGGTVASANTTLDINGVPNFTLTDVPVGAVTLEATSAQVPGVVTVMPVTVPAGGVSGLVFFVKTEDELLTQEGVAADANLVAFIAGGGTITVDGTTSTSGNPTFLTVTPGTFTVTVTPDGGAPVLVPNVTVTAGNVTVIRLPAPAV